MVDLGDEMGATFIRFSSRELHDARKLLERNGTKFVTNFVKTKFSERGAQAIDPNKALCGADIIADRGEFERVLRDGAREAGLTLEESEWEAKTVTDMLFDYVNEMKAEFTANGFDPKKWRVEAITGTFEGKDTITQVSLVYPKGMEKKAQALSDMVAQRVADRNTFDKLIVSKELVPSITKHFRDLAGADAPISVQGQGTSNFAEISFPTRLKGQLEVAKQTAINESLNVPTGQAVRVTMPFASLEHLLRHLAERRLNEEEAGGRTLNRTPGGGVDDGLYQPVYAIDATAKGAEVAEVYVAAHDQSMLLRDIQTLGIRDEKGHDIDVPEPLLADKKQLIPNVVESLVQEAKEVAHNLAAAAQDHNDLANRTR